MTSLEAAHVYVVSDAEAAGGVALLVEVQVLEAGLAPEGGVLVRKFVVGRYQRPHVVLATLLRGNHLNLVFKDFCFKKKE